MTCYYRTVEIVKLMTSYHLGEMELGYDEARWDLSSRSNNRVTVDSVDFRRMAVNYI